MRLLEALAAPEPPPFAILRRNIGPGIELLIGELVDVPRLADIPLPEPRPGEPGPRVLALVPHRQVAERGFVCHDDGAPLRCLVVTEYAVIDLETLNRVFPALGVTIHDGEFDIDDEAYAAIVKRVVADEIGKGEGANFVIRRDYTARIGFDTNPRPQNVTTAQVAVELFTRLCRHEQGAYWTFAVHAGDITLVGATPERHVTMPGDGTVLMNPISGTYRYPPEGPTIDDLLRFLDDPKETEELYMVVDEELKMMSTICPDGGQVLGPYLKPMRHLAHTEYVLAGRGDADPRTVLRETMFAATVTGSPVENACRVITRYEATGRGYYGAALALFGENEAGQRTLDSPIVLRAAQLEPGGMVRVRVGATLVRHSDPWAEVAETHAKAAGILTALGVRPKQERADTPTPTQVSPEVVAGWANDPRVTRALAARNEHLAAFWLQPRPAAHEPERGPFTGHRALIIDAEDAWTQMLAHLLRRLGLEVTVQRWNTVEPAADEAVHRAYHLMVGGPGPGDPRDLTDPRMARLRALIAARLAAGAPLLAVCLSHQILADLLGFPLVAREQPYQGTQREIELFGRRARVGFYNTFTAMASGMSGRAVADQLVNGRSVQVAADPVTGEVYAVRGRGFAGVQFHLESVLSPDGVELTTELLTELLAPFRTS